MAEDVQLLVRGRSRMSGFGEGDDLIPLFWFLRSVHSKCALSTMPAPVKSACPRKPFAPAPGKTSLLSDDEDLRRYSNLHE